MASLEQSCYIPDYRAVVNRTVTIDIDQNIALLIEPLHFDRVGYNHNDIDEIYHSSC